MIEQVIHLTTKSGGLPPVIRAVEGDTGRFLDAYTDDNTVTQFQTAELAVHRPDGSYYSIPASTEYQYGFFYLDLTQALTRAGRVECQLKVSLSTRVISTYTFIIIVEPSTSGLPVEQLGYDIYDLIEAADTIRGSGLTDDIKQALLDCFEHVAWTDEHGQDYVDALEAALYPPANLVSISAVYTQSGTVYDTDSLNSLKDDLVVTAVYSDSTTETVASTDYTLSGTLTEGTSTITVSYGGKTTTFTVTVTEAVIPALYNWDLKSSLTDSVGGVTATTNATFTSGTGLVFDADGQYCDFGAVYALNRTYELDVISHQAAGGLWQYGRFFMVDTDTSTDSGGSGFIFTGSRRATENPAGYGIYTGSAWDSQTFTGIGAATSDNSYNDEFFNGKTLKFYISSEGKCSVSYKTIGADDSTYVFLGTSVNAFASYTNGHVYIGSSTSDYLANATFSGLRVYEGEV